MIRMTPDGHMNVLAALLVLALLIVVHEAGHFLAATLQGIRVSGFSIGFGPALIKRQRRGVTYALRLLPLGGFVAFPDDDEESTIPADDPDLLRNRPIPQQALVVAAGVWPTWPWHWWCCSLRQRLSAFPPRRSRGSGGAGATGRCRPLRASCR